MAKSDSQGKSCSSVVMAALDVIGEACEDGERSVGEIADSTVVSVPSDGELPSALNKRDVSEMTPNEIDRAIESSEWLQEWTEGMCEQSGITSDDPGFSACQRNWARKALDLKE